MVRFPGQSSPPGHVVLQPLRLLGEQETSSQSSATVGPSASGCLVLMLWSSPRAELQPSTSSLLASALVRLPRGSLARSCRLLDGKVLELRARLQLLPQPDRLRSPPGPGVALAVAVLDGDLSTLHRAFCDLGSQCLPRRRAWRDVPPAERPFG